MREDFISSKESFQVVKVDKRTIRGPYNDENLNNGSEVPTIFTVIRGTYNMAFLPEMRQTRTPTHENSAKQQQGYQNTNTFERNKKRNQFNSIIRM